MLLRKLHRLAGHSMNCSPLICVTWVSWRERCCRFRDQLPLTCWGECCSCSVRVATRVANGNPEGVDGVSTAWLLTVACGLWALRS